MIGKTNVSGDYGVGDSIYIENLKGNDTNKYFFEILDNISPVINGDDKAITKDLINFIDGENIFFYEIGSDRYFSRYNLNKTTGKFEEIYKTKPFGYTTNKPVYSFSREKNIVAAYATDLSDANNKIVILDLDNGNAIVSKNTPSFSEEYEKIWIDISDRYIYVSYPQSFGSNVYKTDIYDFSLNLVKTLSGSTIKVLSFTNYELVINENNIRVIDYLNWTTQNTFDISFAHVGAVTPGIFSEILKQSNCFNINNTHVYLGGGSALESVKFYNTRSYLIKLQGTSLTKVSESSVSPSNKAVLNIENGKSYVYHCGYSIFSDTATFHYNLDKFLVEGDDLTHLFGRSRYDWTSGSLNKPMHFIGCVDNNNLLKYWDDSGEIGNVYNVNLIEG